jgi:hypothetical protein
MKIKDGYLLRTVAGSNIVVPVGEGSIDFSGVITLNEVGAFIWKQMAEDTDVDTIVKAVLDEYDIDEATAKADTEEFLDTLRGADLLE